MIEPREPLELSAPIAHRIAPQMCRRNAATGEDCSWLHGFWQCLRLLRLAATPDRHAGFYRRAFEGVAGADGPPKILISGAADYSMLAHVLAIFRSRGIEPSVCVIDVCDTPLHLNRWYAERERCGITTHRGGVLEYAPPVGFDAICTHSFFGQFTREQRPVLIAAWRRLLRPGGLVITTLPLRAWGADERNRFKPEQAEAFRAALRAGSAVLAGVLDMELEEVLRQGESYMKAQYGYPVRSGEEVHGLFGSSGFALDHLDCTVAPTEEGLDAGGPGLRQKGVSYASVIARRL